MEMPNSNARRVGLLVAVVLKPGGNVIKARANER